MKVRDLFEVRAHEEPKLKLTQAEFDALPRPGPNNIEDRFRVGKVAFDNVNGLGNTPNGQNVVYLGFAAELRPSTFLALATKTDRSDDAAKFVKFVEQRVPFASPFLEIAFDDEAYSQGEPLKVRVKNHEGRGRMEAFRLVNGDEYLPVEFILRGGLRARDLTPQFFDDLRDIGFIPQDASTQASPREVKLRDIFWMGKTL